VTKYIAARQEEGAANGTIIQELGVLGRMFRVASAGGKFLPNPIIHRPKAAKPGEGFFERSQFEAVKRHLRPDLQVAVTIAYAFGWRRQSEVLTLRRRQVDLNACTLRLEPGTTKNDDGRTVSLTPELVEMLRAQGERVQLLEMDLGHKVPHLFPYLSGEHKGERIPDFRKAWRTACLEAMLEGLEGEKRTRREAELKAALKRKEKPGLLERIRHDFRRTAVRNMVNRGAPERVAMKITGHKTRAVFDRYHIVSPADLQDAARRLTGTFLGTLTPVEARSRC
jgi:integrase